MSHGKLIVFEGIDGAGKTTLSLLIRDMLQSHVDVVLEYEPTAGPHGRRLRESARAVRLPLADEIDLFIADRREHVEQVIAPALARGAFVLLDRYVWSTVAYQGARGADPNELLARNSEFPEADLTILLDLNPSVTTGRRSRPDVFEQIEYLESVRRTYLRLYQQARGRRLAICTESLQPHRVAALVWEYVQRLDARLPALVGAA
jgi:dTMP kinase